MAETDTWIPSAGQFPLQCTRLFEVNAEDRHMSWASALGHRQKAVKRPYEERTDGETSRKAECAIKVMSGDAQCARKGILLPLAPERSSKALQDTPSREESGTTEILREEEHSHQQAESSGHEKGTANTSAGRSEKH